MTEHDWGPLNMDTAEHAAPMDAVVCRRCGTVMLGHFNRRMRVTGGPTTGWGIGVVHTGVERVPDVSDDCDEELATGVMGS